METIRTSLTSATSAYDVFRGAWDIAKPELLSGHRLHFELRNDTRSLEQNRRMWAMLADVSRQVVWHGVHLTSEEWKDVFSAALKRSKVVPGLDGGFVVVGQSTSRMTVAEMTELMDLMQAFGDQRSVMWSDPMLVAA